jgi:hypothetical protein
MTADQNTRVSLDRADRHPPCVRPRLIYRTHMVGRRDGRKGFAKTDCARLLDVAHQQFSGSIVLVWDNLSTRRSRAMTDYNMQYYASSA